MSESTIHEDSLDEIRIVVRNTIHEAPITDFEVVVAIKKSSKYFHQGLEDPTNRKSKRRFFKLSSFFPSGSYVLNFNSNVYPVEDCEFFLRDRTNPEHLLRIP
jgi:hypothetical protein